MSGFINVDKPSGITSHDVVYWLRKWTKIKRIGHTGTLDPAATGVLPIAIGSANRLISYLSNEKKYLAEIELGVRTTTDDLCGLVIQKQDVPAVDYKQIHLILQNFVGLIDQKPPIYSAIQKDGRRLYDLARKKLEIGLKDSSPSQIAVVANELLADVKVRQVQIRKIELLQIQSPVLQIRIDCDAGTYIRSIARDIGELIGCGASLKSLRREQSSLFMIENALPLQSVESIVNNGQLENILLSPETVLGIKVILVDSQNAKTLVRGNPILSEQTEEHTTNISSENNRLSQYCLAVYSSKINLPIALCSITEGLVKPKIVLISESLL